MKFLKHKVNNVTNVLKPSKPCFALHIQQSVEANTTFSVTNSLYCICQVSYSHLNLVTTPCSCILLTLAPVCKKNLTCSTPSSLSFLCRIPFILGKLKIELTKNPLHRAGKYGEHSCGENLYNGNDNGGIPVGKISMATIQRDTSSHIPHGNVLNTHVDLMTTNIWTPLMDPASQELTEVPSKMEHPIIDPASWKLTQEEKLSPTIQVEACSLKLIGELII